MEFDNATVKGRANIADDLPARLPCQLTEAVKECQSEIPIFHPESAMPIIDHLSSCLLPAMLLTIPMHISSEPSPMVDPVRYITYGNPLLHHAHSQQYINSTFGAYLSGNGPFHFTQNHQELLPTSKSTPSYNLGALEYPEINTEAFCGNMPCLSPADMEPTMQSATWASKGF